MTETVDSPAGRIPFAVMEALKRDLISAGGDESSALRSFRISDAAREYVASGPYQSVPDSKVKADLTRAANLVRAIADLDLGVTAELNILLDFYSDDAKPFEPAYRALRDVMSSHYEVWRSFSEHLERMSESITLKVGSKPNQLVRLLWNDAMRHWQDITVHWPVTTRDDAGVPRAPLYKHVVAMVWGLSEDDAVREAARGPKPFNYVLGCLRKGTDPFER